MNKFAVSLAVWVCLSCTGADDLAVSAEASAAASAAAMPVSMTAAGETAAPSRSVTETLEQFAELERSGSYIQGMGLAESGLREEAGDYAGAVLAAYKELGWAYGRGLAEKADLERALENVLALKGEGGEERAVQAARGLLAFLEGRWEEAEQVFASLFDPDEEPDGFARWLLLVCALEKNPAGRAAGAAYGAIRARYSAFPEYWYRGARFFSGIIGADYAERCVSLAPEGPFADECRKMLAAFLGLEPRYGAALKSRMEIEELISRAVSGKDPQALSGLLPLIELPDNSYTVYAVGALRALAGTPLFRDYFAALAEKSSGRLAERLTYICRGRG
jgi:hypothetical protein